MRSGTRSRAVWLLALALASAASGATFTVTNTADAGAGSLRQAILDAEASAGADAIVFQAGVTGTVNLASALPLITQDLTITGPGAASVTVSGGNAHRVLFVGDGTSGATVSISGVTLANGQATGGDGGAGAGGGGGGLGAGGAIFVNAGANVTIADVALTGNGAGGGAGGAGGVGSGGGGGGGLGGDGGAGSTAQSGASGSGGGGGGFGGNGGAAGTGFAGGGGGGFAGNGGTGSAGGGGGGGGVTGNGGNGDLSTGTSGGGGGGGGTTAGGNATGDTAGAAGTGGGVGGTGSGPGTTGIGAAGGVGGGGGGGGGPDSNNGGAGGAFGGGGGGSFLGDPGGAGGDFGGGGGAAESTTVAGAGGFGAGGGGNVTAAVGGGGGLAGFGGGAGGAGTAGGGGSAFGGAVFVRQGGSLTLQNVSVTGGSVVAGAGSTAGSAEGAGLFLHGGADLTLDAPVSTSSVLADAIGGAGRVVKSGAGRVALTGTNTYTDGTLVTGGVLAISADAGLGAAGGALTLDGGTLELAGSFSTARVVNLNAGGGTVDTAGAAGTLAGGVAGAGSFAKTGNGTLTITGPATYLGSTTVSQGTLKLTGSDERLPDGTAVTVAGGAILDLDGFRETVGSLAGAGEVSLGAGTLIAGGNNSTTLFSGTITGSGNFTKAGTGTMTIAGSSSYSGQTSVTGGVLALGASNRLADASSLAVSAGARFDLAGFDETVGALTGLGTVTLGAGNLTVGGAGTTGAFDGVISGTGSFTKTGAGVLTLGGANTYTGNTLITGGTLALSSPGRIADASAVSITAGALFDLAGFSETVGSLAGAGNVALGAATLTVGGNNTSTSYSGVIAGTGALTKIGTGTMSLGGSNTYTGATNIVEGVLALTASERLANVTAVTISPGARFDVAGFAETIGSLAGSGTVTLGAGALTTGGNNASTTYAGAISGTGSVTKVGTGTFTLSGTNTHTGGTRMNGGVVVAGADENLGAAGGPLSFDGGTLRYAGSFTSNRDVTLNAGGGTLDTNGNDDTITGVVSGTGRLNKTGAGVLMLTGVNTHTGGNMVTGGVLAITATNQLGAAGSLLTLDGGALRSVVPLTVTRPIAVGTAGGAVEGTATIESTITGAGELTLRDGTATLKGPNSFTGGLVIENGTAVAGSDDTLGTGAITFVNGTLRASTSFATDNAVDVQTTGTLEVNGADSLTLSGAIGGAGNLVKTGTGTLVLTGLSPFSGQSQITGGTLRVDGTLGGLTTIGSGARLRGVGGLGAMTASAGSTVAPGNSIGTLTIAGNSVQAAGSTFEVEANAAGESDRLVVGGTATVGGAVRALPEPGNYRFRTRYTILTAGGGVSGLFDSVTSADASLRAFLVHESDRVILLLQRIGGVFDGGLERNAGQVALTLDALSEINQLPVGLEPAIDELMNRTGASREDGLRQLANEERAAATSAVLANTLSMQRAVLGFMQSRRAQAGVRVPGRVASRDDHAGDADDRKSVKRKRSIAGQSSDDRVRAIASEVTPKQAKRGKSVAEATPRRGKSVAEATPRRGRTEPGSRKARTIAATPKRGRTDPDARRTYVPPPPRQNRSITDQLGGLIVGELTPGRDDDEVWAMAVGQFGDVKGTPGAARADYEGGGVVAGRGWKVDENLTLGVHGGFVGTEVRTGAGDRTGIQSYRAGLYGSYDLDDLYLDAIFQVTSNDYTSQRRISLGAVGGLADGTYDGTEVGAYAEAGKTIRHDDWAFQPYVGLQARTLSEDGFVERGAGALNLIVQKSETDSFQSFLGARLFGLFVQDDGARMVPGLSLAWVHEYADTDRPVTAAFIATPRAFVVNGRAAASDALQLRAGLTRILANGIEVDVSYAGEYSSASDAHAILATGVHRF